MRKRANQLPNSYGSRYFTPFPYRVGIVSDEYMYESLNGTCDLRYIYPDSTEEELFHLHLLLVVSTWHGLGNVWNHAGKEGSANNRRLRTLMRTCRDKNIPVAYYSKEDPTNYGFFKNLAADADYVFTSSVETLETYRQEFSPKRAEALPFGANPFLYNPIGFRMNRMDDSALFAGTWMTKYPRRIREQEKIFGFLLQAGVELNILDRSFRIGRTRYRYPLRYWKYILPTAEYQELGNFYKIHKWIINFNSIVDSKTMFAMRVYDALACGSSVISNHSAGMKECFPEVFVVENQKDMDYALSSSDEVLYEKAMESVRHIMSGETSFDRMARILEVCGFSHNFRNRQVAVLIDPQSKNPQAVRNMFERQTYSPRVMIDTPEDLPLASDCDMFAIWTDNRYYGSKYLETMIHCFQFTDCRYVTKPLGGEEHRYTTDIHDKYASVFWRGEFLLEDLYRMPVSFSSPDGYVADRLNYSPAAMTADEATLAYEPLIQ